MPEIKVKVIDNRKLELLEDASKGDIINLDNVLEIDPSFIERLINDGTKKIYEENFKKDLEKKELEFNNKIQLEENKYNSLEEKLKNIEDEYKTKINNIIYEKAQEIKHNQELNKAKNEALIKEYDNKLNNEKLAFENKYKDEIHQLKQKISQQDSDFKFNLEKQKNDIMHEKDEIINKLRNEHNAYLSTQNLILENKLLEQKQRLNYEEQEKINKLKAEHEEEYKLLEQEINALKREKSSLNIKRIGEDLELWCDAEVQQWFLAGFDNCSWSKANKAIKDEDSTKGTKPDYIFSIYTGADKTRELTKICLEMKDEDPNSVNKKHESSHFSKLHKDRQNYNCKYAILVSNLQNTDYDVPIYKVSEYPDMYVVRPAYMITLLSLLYSLTMKFKDYLVEIEKEELELKSKIELRQQFEDLKKTYLENPLTRIENHINDIIKQNDKIYDASVALRELANKIITSDISNIKSKIENFNIVKLEKKIGKLEK